VAELAAGIPVNHGLAEEIIPLQPDLSRFDLTGQRMPAVIPSLR
jgi:hypothetical protein